MAEKASAFIGFVQLSPTSYQYTITLIDNGTTPIGTFWFSWLPGQGYLSEIPTFVAPSGWTASITDGVPPANGYSVRWVADSTATALQPGQSLTGFTFTTSIAPNELFADSSIHPGVFGTTSVVYSAGPFSDGGFDLVAGQLLSGSASNDILIGTIGDDAAYGGSGNDYIYAYGGDDTLVGGDGLDVLLGAEGNDFIYGGTGFNYLFGGSGDDTLIGSGGATASDVNVMYGGDGADFLYGGIGTNYFYGGAGVDTMVGGSGLNIFISSGETDGNFIYGGSGQNYVYGSNGGDTVTGGAGVDVFLMGSGNDNITGGGGVDYAWGGGGSDTFTINDGTPEVMVVQDFNTGGVNDLVNFAGTSLHSFADVQAAEFYSPGINTTIITDAAGSAVWLIGLAPGQLDASMFKFG
ncbi:calcium-binding protein [Bradyrhizobium sp. 27S5]|uniref:calcium-binding protein n=1 Tax=Bradyrhizobium sp. 27S5 TaxID=3139728 RepID=UPI0030D063DA